jgi:glycosyltransferase involved in cell wall biosynthesis
MNYKENLNFLGKALQGVINQSYQNWEIILIDDSRGNELKEQLKIWKINNLKYFLNNQDCSLYELRKQGIQNANGEYIAFLDCDDEWMPTKLETQIQVFENPLISISSTQSFIRVNDEIINDTIFTYQDLIKEKKEIINDYKVVFSTVLMRANIAKIITSKAVPPYNVIEDFDICFQALNYGHLLPIQKPLTTYRRHPDSFSQKNPELSIAERLLWIELLKKSKETEENKIMFTELMSQNILRDEISLHLEKREINLARQKISQISNRKSKIKLLVSVLLLSLFNYILKGHKYISTRIRKLLADR